VCGGEWTANDGPVSVLGCRLLDRHDFAHVSVFLLARNADSPSLEHWPELLRSAGVNVLK